jgi:hypothetical protein
MELFVSAIRGFSQPSANSRKEMKYSKCGAECRSQENEDTGSLRIASDAHISGAASLILTHHESGWLTGKRYRKEAWFHVYAYMCLA